MIYYPPTPHRRVPHAEGIVAEENSAYDTVGNSRAVPPSCGVPASLLSLLYPPPGTPASGDAGGAVRAHGTAAGTRSTRRSGAPGIRGR